MSSTRASGPSTVLYGATVLCLGCTVPCPCLKLRELLKGGPFLKDGLNDQPTLHIVMD
ncbi:MAG: hypothetical protein ACFFB3_24170 [Candidatus Hodarchaeota archaeon]